MPVHPGQSFRRPRLLASVLLCLGAMVCAGVVLFQAARRPGCKAASANGLQQIQMALECYRQAHGCYPPQYLADKGGRPAHSWRILIWPYLCGDDSWKRYRFDEPWNGPHNSLLASETPACFHSPNADPRSKSAITDYVGICGTDTPWRGTRPLRTQDLQGRTRELAQVTV